MHLPGNALRDAGKTTAEERLHDYDGNFALVKLIVEIFGIGVAHPVGVTPVDIIHLYLDEVPVHLPAVVEGDQFLESRLVTVEGETEIADAPGLFFLEQEIYHAVVDIALAVCSHTSPSDGVEKVVIKVVGLELLEGGFVHFERCLRSLVGEI